MKHTILAAALAIAGFSASANASCTELYPNWPAGPSNVTVKALNPINNGNFSIKLNTGATYWVDGATPGAHNLFQFFLVAWQMGTSFDLTATCSWKENGNAPQIVNVISK